MWLLLVLALAQAQPGYEYAVVPGAAQYDGTPSPAFARRLLAALELYREGRVRRIAVAGGRRPGDRTSEGEAGCTFLRARGVPRDRLLCETESRSTYENLRNLRPHLRGRVLIVTDAPHLRRALFLARRLGLEAEGHPVPGRYGLGYWLKEWGLYLLYRLGVFPRASAGSPNTPGGAPGTGL
ncbi:YdcF family protein [Thermus filiformis]|uniref:YdcF family protein n=1 Tax=Thermus filiformis TaxID=276 RepID=UPI001269A713|nr:YdcF family protein [Thermus filiformis]